MKYQIPLWMKYYISVIIVGFSATCFNETPIDVSKLPHLECEVFLLTGGRPSKDLSIIDSTHKRKVDTVCTGDSVYFGRIIDNLPAGEKKLIWNLGNGVSIDGDEPWIGYRYDRSGVYSIHFIIEDEFRKNKTDSLLLVVITDSGSVPLSEPPVMDTAIGIDTSRIKVRWYSVRHALSYTIERSTADDSTFSLHDSTTDTQYVDTGLVMGEHYTYRVVASNKSGKTDPSSAVSATTWFPPEIVEQPESQVTVDGGTITFRIQAEGVPAVTYQWFEDSAAIQGAHDSRYTTRELSQSDSGIRFSCVVSNELDTVISDEAIARVDNRPYINAQPDDMELPCGSTVKFGIAVSGTSVKLQWFKDGEPIPDATADSLTLSPVGFDDAGTYTGKIWNDLDSAWTDGFELQVIMAFPADLHVTDREESVLRLSWDEAPCALWYRLLRAEGAGAFTAVCSTVTTAFIDTPLTEGTTYRYCIIAGDKDHLSDTSSIYEVSTSAGPEIINNPESLSVQLGQPCTLSVIATAEPECTYQWYKNGTALTDAGSAQLVWKAVTVSDTGNYYVVVTNEVRSVRSDTARLSVKVLLTITSDPIEGGTTEPEGSGIPVDAGVPFEIKAMPKDSFMFNGWKVNSGAPVIGDVASAHTTITLQTGPAQITARFSKEYDTIYVDSSAVNGTKDGLNWKNAFTDLQSALSKTHDGSKIYIARGTYFPASSATNRTVTFNLTGNQTKNLSLYGGYTSGGTKRDTALYTKTVLSGELQGDNNATNNFLTVVTIKNNPETVTLDGLKITGGYDDLSGGGGIDIVSGNMVLKNCTISDHFSGVRGGGIYLSDGSLEMNDCVVADASCTVKNEEAFGGAIYGERSSIRFNRCTFNNNSCSAIEGEDMGAWSYGGAVAVYNCTVESSASSFTNNNIATDNSYMASSLGNGGALYVSEGSITMIDDTFEYNWINGAGNDFGGDGGALHCDDATVTLVNCSFNSNSIIDAEWSYGGAISLEGSVKAVLQKCILTKNKCSAESDYGAAMCVFAGVVEITGCLFAYNTVEAGLYSMGGAFHSGSGSIQITNCTFYGNTNTASESTGGAVYASGNPFITNCTFTGNQADTAGGIYLEDSGVVTNCILWNDSALEPGSENEIVAANAKLKNCFIQNYDGYGLDSIYYYQNPMLGNLGQYGCPVPLIPIPENSPAHDKGTTEVPEGVDISVDACDNNRDSKPDIGAYEVQGP